MQKYLINFRFVDGSEKSFEIELKDLQSYKDFIVKTDSKYATFDDGQVNLAYVLYVTYKEINS